MTTLPPVGAPDVLYLIDLSSYVFRAYHAITPLSNAKGEPTHATYGTVNMLQKLVGERKPALLAVAMDSKGATFREKLDPNYKATRAAPPPDLAIQMERAREIVEAYRIPIFQTDGVEADDLIASAVEQAARSGIFMVIVGSDKDLMQLVGERVVMWDTMRDKVYGPAEVEQKFGVPPSQMRDLIALMGDSSDNVPGVPSVGQKTAADLLRQFGSVDGIYAHIDDLQKKKLKEALVAHEADARLSVKLVTLKRDEPIVLDPEKLRYGGADFDKLRALYTELGFTRLIASIPLPERPATGEKAAKAASEPATLRTVVELDALAAIVAEARAVGRLAVGVETTSPEPTRAILVGIGLAVHDGTGHYVPIGHRYIGAPRQLTLDQVREALGPLLADPDVRKVGHDLKYVEVVLSRHGMRLERPEFDTMIASYLIDPESSHALPGLAKRELDVDLPTYDQVTSKARGTQLRFDEVDCERATGFSAGGVECALRLAARLGEELDRQGLAKLMREIEMPLSRVLAAMEETGVLVDFEQLANVRRHLDAEIAGLETEARKLAGREFNPSSPRQLEVILFDELGLKPIKRTKTARSTDAEVLEALAQQHPLPSVLLEHRQLTKLKGTYVDALPALVSRETGRIHTQWSQTVAATGRISSSEPNLQNIPIRTELGRQIRRAFIAPPGARLVSADYSQIELRVLAHLSKDPVLVDAFRRGQDVHERTAMEIFRVGPGEVTEVMRRRAKTINFGVIYGMGEVALAKRLGIPRPEAAAFIEAYFERYAGVRRFMDDTLAAARRGEAVRTLFGRQRLLPNLRSSNGMLRAAAERIAQNTPIQGTAADLLKLAMIRLADPVVPGARMVLTVHDELVFEVPEGDVKRSMGRVKEAMEGVFSLDVPLVVDVGSGANWGELEFS